MIPKHPLRELLRTAFDEEDVHRVHVRVRRSVRSGLHEPAPEGSRWKIWAAAAAAMIIVAVGISAAWPGRSPSAAEPPVVAGPLRNEQGRVFTEAMARRVVLDDGSTIELAPRTRIEAIENTSSTLVLAQSAGEATYDVTPGTGRAWTIDVGLLSVDVLGTRFMIERNSTNAVVRVERGVVRVRGAYVANGLRRLYAGESIRVHTPRIEPAAAARDTDDGAPESEQDGRGDRRARSPETRRWRDLVNEGDYRHAYAALEESGIRRELEVAPDASTLWALADAARFSGHPVDAVPPLSRLVDEGGEGSRSAVAAFTLGRIYSESLARPHRAAAAFEDAIRLGPPNGINEACHVRLVESLERVGDARGARLGAGRYLELFPRGRHAERFRLLVATGGE